jgi:hypothetical protein
MDSELRKFWHRLWVLQESPFQSETVLRGPGRVVDIEVSETREVLYGLPTVFRSGDVLVREEYKKALEVVRSCEGRKGSLIIVGHPGIGILLVFYMRGLAHQ